MEGPTEVYEFVQLHTYPRPVALVHTASTSPAAEQVWLVRAASQKCSLHRRPRKPGLQTHTKLLSVLLVELLHTPCSEQDPLQRTVASSKFFTLSPNSTGLSVGAWDA